MSVTVSTETVPLEVFCKVSYPRPGRGARTLPCRRASQPDLLSRLCPGDGEPWSPTRPTPHQPRTSHVTDGRPGGGRRDHSRLFPLSAHFSLSRGDGDSEIRRHTTLALPLETG